MNKKYIILIVYSFYILFLIGVAVYYQKLDELPHDPGFFSGFGRALEYAIRAFWLYFLSSWIFFCLIHFIYKKLNIAFVFVAPLLLFLVGLGIYLVFDFVLWISRLRPDLHEFQKAFIITSLSSTIIMIWFWGDIFRRHSVTGTIPDED